MATSAATIASLVSVCRSGPLAGRASTCSTSAPATFPARGHPGSSVSLAALCDRDHAQTRPPSKSHAATPPTQLPASRGASPVAAAALAAATRSTRLAASAALAPESLLATVMTAASRAPAIAAVTISNDLGTPPAASMPSIMPTNGQAARSQAHAHPQRNCRQRPAGRQTTSGISPTAATANTAAASMAMPPD